MLCLLMKSVTLLKNFNMFFKIQEVGFMTTHGLFLKAANITASIRFICLPSLGLKVDGEHRIISKVKIILVVGVITMVLSVTLIVLKIVFGIFAKA